MRIESSAKHIFSVSELTAEIKTMLEENFRFVWVYGEISNFRKPSSGHLYFTLKDDKAQISAVMFRGQQAGLKFMPCDGMEITGLGRVAVYEPRGTYQVILEYAEPKGVGALQKAFEQLKSRLSDEGLFDAVHKKPIAFLPSKIVLITSPTGAVVHDMLNIMFRRCENIHVQIFPVRVQGNGAAEQIAEALSLVGSQTDADVVILARGGGSLEDFQAFNSETVARAIFSSRIPVVAAVGHETDYTIADFVADLRAPTPSAAAELVVPVKNELKARCSELFSSLVLDMFKTVENFRNRVIQNRSRLVHPQKRLQDFFLRLDDLSFRMNRLAAKTIEHKRERLEWKTEKLRAHTPAKTIEKLRATVFQANTSLLLFFKISADRKRSRILELESKLSAMDPSAILARGYSIVRKIPEGSIVRDASRVTVGRMLEITLEKGELTCRVEGKSSHE